MLVGEVPQPPLLCIVSMQAAPPCGMLLRMSIGTSYEKSDSFLAQGSIEEFDGSWYNSRCVVRFAHEQSVKELLNVDTIYLLPGEERCVDFRDANGVPKVHYTYCSIRGKLFNCTCCTKAEAQRLCEDWLVKQDRCYIN